jgi:LPXTG-motif cell wall-anchored protein
MTSIRLTRARSISSIAIVGALALGTLLAAPAATAAPAPGVPEQTKGLEYVALGDSYSAGLGIEPSTGLPAADCGQSAANYPHQLAAANGLDLTDLSCQGATTNDVVVGGQFGLPAQISGLSASTDIVTITIGGNDAEFTAVTAGCIALSENGSLAFNEAGPNCKTAATQGGVDLLAARIAGPVTQALSTTFAAIAEAAPNAKIFVLGYPSLFPETLPEGGCFSPYGTPNAYPFTNVDVPYLHSLEVALDAAVQTTAANAGLTYVSTFASSFAHTPCAGAAAYVNGITATEAGVFPGSLHPNAAGVAFLTDSVSLALDAAFPAAVAPPTTTATGTTPSGAAPAAKRALANTGVEGTLLASGLALAMLLLAAGAVLLRRRASAR